MYFCRVCWFVSFQCKTLHANSTQLTILVMNKAVKLNCKYLVNLFYVKQVLNYTKYCFSFFLSYLTVNLLIWGFSLMDMKPTNLINIWTHKYKNIYMYIQRNKWMIECKNINDNNNITVYFLIHLFILIYLLTSYLQDMMTNCSDMAFKHFFSHITDQTIIKNLKNTEHIIFNENNNSKMYHSCCSLRIKHWSNSL